MGGPLSMAVMFCHRLSVSRITRSYEIWELDTLWTRDRQSSEVDRIFTSVCLSFCTISQKPMQLGSPNLS